jgi:hypothetical protein
MNIGKKINISIADTPYATIIQRIQHRPTASSNEIDLPPHQISRRAFNPRHVVMLDRDGGPSSHRIVTPFQATSTTVPKSVVLRSQQTRSPTLSCLDCSPVMFSQL